MIARFSSVRGPRHPFAMARKMRPSPSGSESARPRAYAVIDDHADPREVGHDSVQPSFELGEHLSERYDPALSPYPLHAGADRYYRRDEPSIVQRYLNEISLAITVGALLSSALSGLGAARRQRQRSRIETHYAAVRRLVTETTEPAELRKQLVLARDKALAELVDEKLDANDAYLILQDYINARIAEIDRA